MAAPIAGSVEDQNNLSQALALGSIRGLALLTRELRSVLGGDVEAKLRDVILAELHDWNLSAQYKEAGEKLLDQALR